MSEKECEPPAVSEEEEKKGIRRFIDAIMVEGMLLVLLAIFFIWVVLTVPTRIGDAIQFSIENLVETIPIFIVASLLAGWVDAWVDKDIVTRLFHEQNLIVSLFVISVLGILTPGPIYSIFPIVWVLRKKGIQSHYLIAYLTGQTLMGPMRIPLELYYLGVPFFIFRVISSVILGVFAGLCAYPLRKKLDVALDEVTCEFER
ncbi:MAG: permease [Candidatus Thorarchaeota archaeon]